MQAGSPGAGLGTHDEYELGDLSGKHGLHVGLDYVMGWTWDHFLPLWGPWAIGSSVWLRCCPFSTATTELRFPPHEYSLRWMLQLWNVRTPEVA